MLAAKAEVERPYDVVIVERRSVERDGSDLRGLDRREDLGAPAAILTLPIGTSIDTERLAAAGFATALTKPVKPSALLDALMDSLAGRLLEDLAGEELQVEPVAPLPAPEPKRESGEQQRLLLVEDNAVNQKLALAMLKKLGYQAEVAVDGQEAVDRLSEERFALVLMDCQMPVLDGYEATRVIRDPESSVLQHRIPIVAMTANAMQGDREKCIAAGMDDYLAKPIRPADLGEKLEAWLAEPEQA